MSLPGPSTSQDPPPPTAVKPSAAAAAAEPAAVEPAAVATEPAAIEPAAEPATAPSTVDPSNDRACLFVIHCPLENDPWATFTCILGFLAAFVTDGICLSLVLYDGRVGMCEYVPDDMHTVEHIAVISLFRYLIGPFSCAYINRYGFRYGIFVGSLLSITWIASLIIVGDAFLFEYSLYLAIIGGIGMGMLNMSFFVLISSIFIENRHTAHTVLQLGSFVGMMIVPPLTEYILLATENWKIAMYLPLGLTIFTLWFWLFIATPVPLKIEVVNEDPLLYTFNNKSEAYSSTVWSMVKNKKLKLGPFKMNTPISLHYDAWPKNKSYYLKDLSWLYEEEQNRKGCYRNLANMFKAPVIGSRPMYRDDILFNTNVKLLTAKLKISEYDTYLLKTSRILTVDDLNEEKYKPYKINSIAMTRVLLSMYNLSILCEIKFIVFAACEALIHASCLIPFIFIKGPDGDKTSAEAMITLIAGCVGLLAGRGVGYLFHETTSHGVPLYHVVTVLIANGLTLLMCTTNNLAKMIPYFALFGCSLGYYKSIQNVILYTVFPLDKLNNIHGHISLIRALSSIVGIWIALCIQRDDMENADNVYTFAGILMMAGGASVGLLQASEQVKRRPKKRKGRLQQDIADIV